MKPEVYFTEDKSGTYTDSVGNVYNYSYKIPAFSGGSEDAERINKYFDDALRPIVEDELSLPQAPSARSADMQSKIAIIFFMFISPFCSIS